MKETLPLDRIVGMRIGLHRSALVIVALMTVMPAVGRFPQAHPVHPEGVYRVLALLAAVVFLTSLPAHWFAHTVVGGLLSGPAWLSTAARPRT